MLSEPTRLAVWGDPITHSKSPAMHTAAYRQLGLAWEYGRQQVTETEFTAALGKLDESWRGLSLTMPLKSAAFAAAAETDEAATLTGAVNTLLLTGNGPVGFNTDVGGIVEAVTELGVTATGSARIIGAGATATSALVALSRMGFAGVDVVARRPEAAHALAPLGERLGIAMSVTPMRAEGLADVSLTVATLPGGATIDPGLARALAERGGALLDVVYGDWPTALATAWEGVGPAASGLSMLLNQAVLQVRAFTTGSVELPLPEEAAVRDTMRRALMKD